MSEKQVDVLLDQLRAQQVSISKTIEADVNANIEFDKKIRQFRDRLSQAKADLVEVNRRKTELERKAESERKAVEDRKREAERANGEMETPTPPVPTVMPGLLRQLNGEAEALSELVRKLEAEVNEMETLELQAGRLREQASRRVCTPSRLRQGLRSITCCFAGDSRATREVVTAGPSARFSAEAEHSAGGPGCAARVVQL